MTMTYPHLAHDVEYTEMRSVFVQCSSWVVLVIYRVILLLTSFLYENRASSGPASFLNCVSTISCFMFMFNIWEMLYEGIK